MLNVSAEGLRQLVEHLTPPEGPWVNLKIRRATADSARFLVFLTPEQETLLCRSVSMYELAERFGSL